MDSEIIYTKTAFGEEAMHQRTRVMQRNVRMVLILVDGQSTVADLSLKTGNPQLTESALRELEKGGFIELVIGQDSLWEESKKVAQEIRAAAVDKALQFTSPRTRQEPSMAEPSASMQSIFQAPLRSDLPMSQFSISPAFSERASVESAAPVTDRVETRYPFPTKPLGNNEAEPSFAARIKAFFRGAREKGNKVTPIKPIRRGHRNSMGWPAIIGLGIFAVFGLASLLVYFFPYERYLPEVESVIAEASGQPVKVASMRVDIYPKPGLLLGDVRLGQGKDELAIAEIRLQPSISTLMASKKMFREVVLSGAQLPAELIAGLPSVFQAISRPESRIGIERISFEKTTVSFGGLGFSDMEGETRLSAPDVLESLVLRTPDRSLTLQMKPLARGVDVSLEGFGWRPSQASPFLFDSVNLKGSINNGTLTISSLELRLFDGLVQGVAILQAGANPSISGDVMFERINSTRFGNAIGIGQQFAGEASGKMRFSAIADSWANIFSEIGADGEFSMQRGSIRGVDLTEAVRRASGAPVQGGSTLFEQLSGKIRLTPTSYQFPGLVLNSGLMQSSGHIEVSKDLKVSGRMDLQMRGTVNQMRVPVTISGPLKAPEVQVGKSF